MSTLTILSGQASSAGLKPVNQDYHAIHVPEVDLKRAKGIAVALADGISSSDVSDQASRSAITGFIEDYYSTSDAWSVSRSAECVIQALNNWLFSQTRQSEYRYNLDKGYVCTFSALILKSSSAYWFHIGDARIYLLRDGKLKQLTTDHRVIESSQKHYLQRALGMGDYVEVDFAQQPLQANDIYILATDGVYEHVSEDQIIQICSDVTLKSDKEDYTAAAQDIIDLALKQQSDDNLTVQIVKVSQLGDRDLPDMYQALNGLPFPEKLKAGDWIDQFQIIDTLYVSPRSYLYRALDDKTKETVVIKVPAQELRENQNLLDRFLTEEWIAKRISNNNVLPAYPQSDRRNYIYHVTEFIDGQTLKQWMIDNPAPNIESVRNIIEQIAKGLQAFHRLEMVHQDLRPENVIIDTQGVVKIIDFGSVSVAGLDEMLPSNTDFDILGTAQYSAPEYFLGERGDERADLFSLAVIAYQMLSGNLPYGTKVAKTHNKRQQSRLSYRSLISDSVNVPEWVDYALKKALHPNPQKRHEVMSEFLYDFRHPSKEYRSQNKRPLIERNPVRFWKMLSSLLAACVMALLAKG